MRERWPQREKREGGRTENEYVYRDLFRHDTNSIFQVNEQTKKLSIFVVRSSKY